MYAQVELQKELRRKETDKNPTIWLVARLRKSRNISGERRRDIELMLKINDRNY